MLQISQKTEIITIICNFTAKIIYQFLFMIKNMLAVMAAAVLCSFSASAINFVPLPNDVKYGEGTYLLKKGLAIKGGNQFNVTYLTERLDRVFDFKTTATSGEAAIVFASDASLGNEAYTLEVGEKGVMIKSSSIAGEFYAIQTLLQMLPPDVYREVSGANGMQLKEWALPYIKIIDSPRFAYRGSMFDVSRTFFDKAFILRHLDVMAYHKLNKFHWHLTDDNGWRIEIKKYPKLTQVGAWRGKNEALPPAYNSGPDSFGGYYTQQDIKEIVAYAAERNIEIIPEIDLPGHSKAIAVSYPEILCHHDEFIQSVQGEVGNVFCVGNEANYKMLDNIFKEVAALFPSQYINIGGDEVATANWKVCPSCQALMQKMGYDNEKQLMNYFVERMEKIAAKHGKKIAGWHDIVVGDISRDNLVVAWKSRNATDAIMKGFPTVMQPAEYCYFDMKHSLIERGHTWAAIVSVEKAYSFDPLSTFNLTDDQKKLVVGPAGGLWTEMLFFPPHFADYQLYPRMCAIAEVGWTEQNLRNYEDFDGRLKESHFARMWNMGLKFRIPTPEIAASQNAAGEWSVYAESPYDNMVVRYTCDGTSPDCSSPIANGKITASDARKLRFATFFNDVKSIDVEVPGCHKYLTPATHVTTSFDTYNWSGAENLEKYDFTKYMRTSNLPKAGDYILYAFEEPLTCEKITVQTNDPVNQFFGITEGHVEVNYADGSTVNAGDFDMYNRVVIDPVSKPVNSVKIVVDGTCEEKQVSIQCLKIE